MHPFWKLTIDMLRKPFHSPDNQITDTFRSYYSAPVDSY